MAISIQNPLSFSLFFEHGIAVNIDYFRLFSPKEAYIRHMLIVRYD